MMRCLAMLPGGAKRGLSELEQACRIARELGDVAAQADLLRQLSAARYLCGRPRLALEAANESELCLRQAKPPPVDIHSAMSMVGSALVELGELREAHRRWNAFAHESRLHGDLTTTLWLHGHPAQFMPLFAMEKRDRAEAVLERQARLRELHPRYRPLAWMHALCKLECELYWGSPPGVEQAMTARALFRGGYGIFTETSRLSRARARLAVAVAEPRGIRRARLLMGAASDANVRGRRRSVMQNGTGLLVEAGIAVARDRPDLALSRLDAAIRNFETAEAKLMIVTAKYCQGALLGGDSGRTLKSEAAAVFAAEGVRVPARWVGWVACGFRSLLDSQ